MTPSPSAAALSSGSPRPSSTKLLDASQGGRAEAVRERRMDPPTEWGAQLERRTAVGVSRDAILPRGTRRSSPPCGQRARHRTTWLEECLPFRSPPWEQRRRAARTAWQALVAAAEVAAAASCRPPPTGSSRKI